MKKKKILWFIVAKSGVGKDYVINILCNNYNKQKVISKTERQPRGNYEIGINHQFVSSEIADMEYPTALGKTIFDNNRYWVTIDDLKDKDFYIIDQQGVKTFDYNKLLKDLNTDVRVIYIKDKWYVRLYHMLKRGDSLKSAINRLKHDRKAFDEEYLESIAYKTMHGSTELYNYLSEVCKNE